MSLSDCSENVFGGEFRQTLHPLMLGDYYHNRSVKLSILMKRVLTPCSRRRQRFWERRAPCAGNAFPTLLRLLESPFPDLMTTKGTTILLLHHVNPITSSHPNLPTSIPAVSFRPDVLSFLNALKELTGPTDTTCDTKHEIT